jgi:hypothetical protein
MEFKIAEDRSRLDIVFPGTNSQTIELTAPDVEQLIRLLGTCRATMSPPRSAADPLPGTPMTSSQNMRWAVVSWQPVPYQLSVCVFERGLGWVSIGLDRAEALRLSKGLEAQIEHLTLTQ